MAIDYQKTPSDKRVTVAFGPTSAATGIADVYEPTADELNNVAGSSMMIPASQSISWNDWSFGTEASEVVNEPSLADEATYEEFGTSNYGGDVSFYLPERWDDNSNLHADLYALTKDPGVLIDAAVRIDGDTETSVPFADADFVYTYRVSGETEANPFTPGESKRRTVGFNSRGEFDHYTVVGGHAITAVEPAAFEPGGTGRIRGLQQGRDVTNSLEFSTSDGDVINVYPGGFFQVTGADTTTATVTISDPDTDDSTTVEVTVAAPGGGE